VCVSEEKKISLPSLGMESQFVAYLKTLQWVLLFCRFCPLAEVVTHDTSHEVVLGHDLCFFKFVRILS